MYVNARFNTLKRRCKPATCYTDNSSVPTHYNARCLYAIDYFKLQNVCIVVYDFERFTVMPLFERTPLNSGMATVTIYVTR